MTLHEAIKRVLKENNRPMTAKEITSTINSRGYYYRSDKAPLQSIQIQGRARNYPQFFHNVSGYILLTEDTNWRQLWVAYQRIVDSLKGIYILSEMQFIIAVLLFYKRCLDKKHDDNIISSKYSFDGLKSMESDRIGPEGIFDECYRLLTKLDAGKGSEVLHAVRQIDTSKLEDKEFGDFFEYLITLDSLDSYKSSINHTSYNLAELMVGILDPESGKSIYDPVAGIGGLLIQAFLYSGSRSIAAKGSEINQRLAQLGNMNLLLHGINNVQIEAKDCFEEINRSEQYDYIIADLPANGITNSNEHVMLYNRYGLNPPKSGKSFGSLVLLVLSKLNGEGKAVLTVSDGFLVKSGKEKEIRDLLIKEDVIESVVSLPYGTLRPYTDAKASVLILNKNKSNYLKNRIQFIAAKATEHDAKTLVLNTEDIIRAYAHKETVSKEARIVKIADLRPNSNLSADAYDTQYALMNLMLKEGTGKPLGELAEIRAGMQPEKSDINIDGTIPLIKVENLSKDILDITLSKEINNRVTDKIRYSKSIISENCILIARIGDSVKATIFRPSDEVTGILPHINVIVLIPRSEMVNIEYLYYQLYSLLVQEQIEKKRLGVVMPYISIESLKQIVIPYVALEAQTGFVASQKASLVADERIRVNDRIKALGYKEEVKQTESDIIKTLTHQLRPTFLGLSNLVNRINRIIDKEKLGTLKEYNEADLTKLIDLEISEFTNKPDNYVLSELLNKLSNDTKHLSAILSNVDKVMNFKLSAIDLKEVNILGFIQSYVQQKEIEGGRPYTMTVNGDSVIVLLNEAAFKELLDQLLLNAETHGFKKSGAVDTFKIQFIVKYDEQREVVSIEYSNNGEPYKLKQRDFISAFEKGQGSTGSGIGGNYIYRIVEAHRGKLIVAEKNSKGFFLTIELPTPQNEGYE